MERLAYTVNETRDMTGISRESLYKAIREGRLIAVKHGKRTLIRREDLEAFMGSLERIKR